MGDALQDVLRKYCNLYQGNNMTLLRYHELFLAQVPLVEELGIPVVAPSYVEVIAKKNNRAGSPNDDDRAEAKQQTYALQFIKGAQKTLRDPYLAHLRNDFLEGNDVYPTTLEKAYNVLSCRDNQTTTGPRQTRPATDGVAFAQAGTTEDQGSTNDGESGVQDRSHITCFTCGERGHYANQCTANRQAGHQAFRGRAHHAFLARRDNHAPGQLVGRE